MTYEYRITASRKFGLNGREDVSGFGSPFSEDNPMWKAFEQGELKGLTGLMQALVEDAVADGHEDIHIERRLVTDWARIA
jgi:hypothetical protein